MTIKWIARIILALIFILSFANVIAQEPVSTTFSVSCVEPLSLDHYRVHFGYTSDGDEAFTAQLVNNGLDPESGIFPDGLPTSFINTPASFTTEVGTYDGWYYDAHAGDNAHIFTVEFTNSLGTVALQLNPLYGTDFCERVVADETPVPVEYDAWAIDSAVGEIYGYKSVPSGIVPLPPPPKD